MILTAQRFTNRVENYVKYRPSYAPQVVSLLKQKWDLKNDSVVADLGSGVKKKKCT
jgi:hypothetical protein